MALSRQPAPGKNPRKLVTAKSIPGSSQAQCPFNATAGFLSMFHCQGISESCRRYKRVRQPGACSALPRVAEQDKREWGNMMKALLCLFFCAAAVMAADKTVYDFTLNSIDGQPAPLAAYKGKVVLLVNVASRCGFTP